MIREYQKTDWPEVKALYEEALAEWLDISHYPIAVYADIHKPLTEDEIEVCVVNADSTGAVTGLLVGGKYIGKTLFVYDFYVTPEFRVTLVPGRMYRLFEALATAKGYERIIFETSPYHKNYIEMLGRADCHLCKLQFAKELNKDGRT